MNTRTIALVNLIALVSSTFSPLYADTREERLRERERVVTERTVTVTDREISLDDREQAIARKNAELQELARVIQERNIEQSVREIEFDDLRAKFTRDSELLASQSAELARDREQLAALRTEAEKRASEAERVAREADERLKSAQTREAQAQSRERELTAREEELAANLSQLAIARAEVLMSQKNSEEIQARLAELDQQEQNFKKAQEIFASEKARLAQDRESLFAQKAEAERAMSEARTLIAEAEEKTKKAEAILAMNEQQKAQIAQLEAQLKAKTKELDSLFVSNPGPNIAELISDAPSNAAVTLTEKGLMNWSDGSIRAKGLGIGYPDKPEEQSKALARRAAIVDLQRNLIETIQGVQIDSKTTVKDFMATDTVSSAVSGTIRGVEIVEEKWDGKTYVVLGQVRQDKMAGAMSEVMKRIRMAKKPKESGKKTGTFTGLIIDARHLPLEQQKYFHVVDETGKMVYGIEYADKNLLSRIGLCAYFDKIVLTTDEQRVGANPMVVKAQRLTNENTDIVIPNDFAAQIRKNKVDFRKDCKVIVVISQG